MKPVTEYYIDESGNTGDLANVGVGFEFGQQPVFVLGCVGVDDPSALGAEITRLKALHRVQGSELKSASVRDKPRFVADLLKYLAQRDLPVLIEVVEKRFNICAAMVNSMVMPGIATADLSQQAFRLRNIIAEYMRGGMPDEVMAAYVAACSAQSFAGTDRAYQSLLNWVSTMPASDAIAEGIKAFTSNTYADYLALDPQDPDTWRVGLPTHDDGKRGKPYWMLANLSSFTNIYARLNLAHAGRVGHLKLLHDEQLQFDDILLRSKGSVEQMNSTGSAPAVRFADYQFFQVADLQFVVSSTEPGIQVADVLAGFVMRYVQDMLFSKDNVSPARHATFQQLLSLSDPPLGLGVNFVTTTRDAHRLGVIIA